MSIYPARQCSESRLLGMYRSHCSPIIRTTGAPRLGIGREHRGTFHRRVVGGHAMSGKLAAILDVSAALGLGIACAMLPAFAADHPNLSGFWEPRSLGVQFKGRPAYTAAARDAMAHAPRRDPHSGTDVADTNCLAMSQPWTLYQSAPIDITQDDRETTMMYEGRSLPWHIYTDGRSHPDLSHYRGTLNGHSIGRWEGDAFVVDSVGFSIHEGAKG